MELALTIAVVGVAMAAAIPGVNGYLTRHAPQYAANELFGDIQLARLRAARYNRRCRIQFNVPGPNQYTIRDVDNAGNFVGGPFRVVNLAKFRDNITFVNSPLAIDPPPYATLEFLSQGVVNVSTRAPANSTAVYLTNQANDVFYRVLVSVAGGSSVDRFDVKAKQWRN